MADAKILGDDDSSIVANGQLPPPVDSAPAETA